MLLLNALSIRLDMKNGTRNTGRGLFLDEFFHDLVSEVSEIEKLFCAL